MASGRQAGAVPDVLKLTWGKQPMHLEIETFNDNQAEEDRALCELLASVIDAPLPEATSKIWHRHPVWFLNDNPTVGYSRLKAGLRLMFWSGADFEEEDLKPGTGKFKDASIIFTSVDEVNLQDLMRWLKKSKKIQWDYKNIAKRKGELRRVN